MAFWVYRSNHGELAVVESMSWLAGLPQAMAELGLDAADLPRVRARQGRSGVVQLVDPEGQVRLHARSFPSAETLPEWVTRDGSAPAEALGELEGSDVGAAVLVDGEQPLPPMPYGVAEKVFEATGQIAEAPSIEVAAERALGLLWGFVPHDAGSVLYAGLDTARFTFLASHGPRAQMLDGVELPFGEGIVGHVHDTGIAVLIPDLTQSARHLHGVDLTTGYRPKALIAAPMRTDDGRTFGVIELLNEKKPFEAWHLDVLEEVGRALAERMASDEVTA